MDVVAGLQSVLGFLLVFFVPGFLVTKATFPEWRARGSDRLLRLIEYFSLGLVLSVALTILVGFGLLNLSPSRFQANWSDPVLEAILAGISVVAFGVGVLRRAWSPDPPAGPVLEEAPGTGGEWELLRAVERLTE